MAAATEEPDASPSTVKISKPDSRALRTNSSPKDSLEIVEVKETGFTYEVEEQLRASKSPAHPIISFWRRSKEKARYKEVATQPSVFDDPDTAAYYTPPPTYENAHRFDAKFRWTWGEELPLVTRLDCTVTVWAMMLWFIVDLNKGNLSQANSDNFLDDLRMNTDDYSLGLSVSRITAILAECPVQLLSRKVGV